MTKQRAITQARRPPRGGRGEPRVALPGARDPLDPSRALPPGAHKLSRDHVEQVQRDRLIDAIVRTVADEGYEGATVKEIASRAGIGLRTFYEHFESKEDLFLAAYQAGIPTLIDEVFSTYSDADISWDERVERSITKLLEILADNPAFALFFTVEGSKAGPLARDRIDEAFELSFTLLQDDTMLAAHVAPERLRFIPLIVGGIYTRIHLWIRCGKTAKLPDLAPELSSFVVAVLRPDWAPRRARSPKKPAPARSGS